MAGAEQVEANLPGHPLEMETIANDQLHDLHLDL